MALPDSEGALPFNSANAADPTQEKGKMRVEDDEEEEPDLKPEGDSEHSNDEVTIVPEYWFFVCSSVSTFTLHLCLTFHFMYY